MKSMRLLVLALLVITMSCQKDEEEITIACNIPGYEDMVFEYDHLEIKPLFPGCSGEGDNMETIDCSNRLMLEYLYDEINFPREARENGIDGTVETVFVINENGRMEDLQIIKGVGGGITEEVERVLGIMTRDILWIPGKCGSEEVAVRFELPVQFVLQ